MSCGDVMVEAGTLCINTDVEKYSGANGNSTADAEAYTNVYIKEAEGVVSAIIRKDAVTDYSDFNTVSKETLREITAIYAAMCVISYDMSGYTSRIEAEDMINILWAKFRQLKKIIEDQKWVTFAQT